MTDRISGSAFKQMIAFGAACVAQQKQAINDLNVLPVPDGDTGTNMSLTIQTAVNELKKSEPATVGEAAKITAGALLRGARGNSGVILSLLFRGISKSAKGLVEMDGPALAAAMGEGVATAYGAVMKPAEGTVLTVSRLAAARAAQAAQENPSAEYVLEQAILAGQETLAQTIDMNPVLKKAGVVDAGGKGYLIILDGMLRALRGEELPQVEEDEKAQDKADFGGNTEDMPTVEILGATSVPDVMVAAGIAKSKGEARRLIEGGGVTLDEIKLTAGNLDIPEDLKQKGSFVLHKGKKTHINIILK